MTSGWQIAESQYEVYTQRFYHRKIIPDIVMRKGNNYAVFDAKYKKMKYSRGFDDVDRNDFFQIHTYISFLQTIGNVVLGGLIYPVTEDTIVERAPLQLYGNDQVHAKFVVDGPLVENEQSINTDRLFSGISNFMSI